MRLFLVSLFCLLLSAPLAAQKQKREPLTEKQQDQIEEAGSDPAARVDLYVKFLNDYSDTIKGLIPRAKSAARARRIDDELQDFAALMDELGLAQPSPNGPANNATTSQNEETENAAAEA